MTAVPQRKAPLSPFCWQSIFSYWKRTRRSPSVFAQLRWYMAEKFRSSAPNLARWCPSCEKYATAYHHASRCRPNRYSCLLMSCPHSRTAPGRAQGTLTVVVGKRLGFLLAKRILRSKALEGSMIAGSHGMLNHQDGELWIGNDEAAQSGRGQGLFW